MNWEPERSQIPQGYVTRPESFEMLEVSHPEPGIAVVTLSRPEKLNAFNIAMLREFRSVMWDINFDPQIRVIIVTGAGRGFCTGRDVAELRTERGMAQPQYRAYVRANHEAFDDIEAIEKPVIAMINGVCAGGGIELAASCDFRIGCESSTYLLPEVFIGVIPASGAASRMVSMIGIEAVKDLMMTGRTVQADEMKEMGFVRRVVPDADLYEETLEFARLLMKGAPVAVGIAKHVVNTCQNVDTDTGRVIERLAQSALSRSRDSTEGLSAFLDKRKPNFRGE